MCLIFFSLPILLLLLQMLVKQKEANRQSMILLQSAEPSVQLLKALEDVAAITKTLEQERLQHRQKVRTENWCSFGSGSRETVKLKCLSRWTT